MKRSDLHYHLENEKLDVWLPQAKHELDVHYNTARKEVDTYYDAAKHELDVSYNVARHKLDDRYNVAKNELICCYLSADDGGDYIDNYKLRFSLENAWLPAFVDDYIDDTRIQANLRIITSDGQVTLAHKHIVRYNPNAKLNMIMRNDKFYITEDYVNKEALNLLLQLLYLDECVAGPRMEKYGSNMMVASSLFMVASKDLIVGAMKDSLNSQNCHEVWKAIQICTKKYDDNFYNHDEHGLRKMCEDFMRRSADALEIDISKKG